MAVVPDVMSGRVVDFRRLAWAASGILLWALAMAIIFAVLRQPWWSAGFGAGGMALAYVLRRIDLRHMAMLERHRAEAMSEWQRILARWEESVREFERHNERQIAWMWADVCIFTNLLDLTPMQARRSVERVMARWQQKYPVN